jgi:hypothetical protein
MVENDAFGQIVVKIGDFGSAFFSAQDKQQSQGNLITEFSLIRDKSSILSMKQEFVTMSYIGP